MIVFSQVNKSFGDTLALSDVSFTIPQGELVVITGPSGSGKTTIMRLLTREYQPTSGEITFNDINVSSMKGSKVHLHRRKIGVIFQDYRLLPEYNVWENIALPLYIVGKSTAEIESRVTDLLKLVGLAEKAFLFPSQLSGGEAQRVGIARALATAPAVIFADEPTGNLDPEASVAIAKLLHKINELGTTVLLATHDLGVLDLLTAERHLKLDKGTLIHDSRPYTEAKAAEAEEKVEKETKTQETPTEPSPPPTPEAAKPTPAAPKPKSGGWLSGLGGWFSQTSKGSQATSKTSKNEGGHLNDSPTVVVESLDDSTPTPETESHPPSKKTKKKGRPSS